ncbi:hypothetical protein PV726_32785 [Streptomyces europaeiscabiei]|uniref:hypothetical protein n=1 Tax=Streptomyces europaeiscabiei TaxID=146819 RepID=UPI0029BB6061|nr:hypothetical protein [Streptomyces europaeiscabiei]MDX3695033.1 hypothetical protein [Streptomyces europaeiscabiei]
MVGDNLMLVREDDQDLWVAVERHGRIYVYDPARGEFRYHPYLSSDWLDPGSSMAYVPLDEHTARELATAGEVGRLPQADGPSPPEDASQVLALDMVLPEGQPPSARDVRQARIRNLQSAPPGTWVTLRELPKDKRTTADVWASDIRTGKNRSYRGLGPLEVRVERSAHSPDELVVIARRVSDEPPRT